MLVHIHPPVIRDLVALAHSRDDPKRKYNRSSAWRRALDEKGKPSSLAYHLLGLLGEYAAGQVLGGVDVDREINDGDRGRGDLVLPDGRTMQVKTRSQPYWDLALSTGDRRELKADGICLCWPFQVPSYEALLVEYYADTEPSVTMCVHGWCDKYWFWKHGKVLEDGFGFGPRFVMSWRDVRVHPIRFIEPEEVYKFL